MKQPVVRPIIMFLIIHILASLAWANKAPLIKDGLLFYTDNFGARTSIPIEDIEDLTHEVHQIAVPEGASDQLKEEIRLRNLENAWIHARHYFRVGRKVIDISLAQSIEIVRARQMRNDDKHPNKYLTDEERALLEYRMREARESISSQNPEFDSQIPRAEKKIATTEVDKVVAEAIKKTGGVWTMVLDGIPYFLNARDDGNLMVANFRFGGQPNRVEVRSQEVLDCNLPTTPPTTPDNRFRLRIQGDTRDFYALVGNLNMVPSLRVLTFNTATGNSFCTTGPSQRIFSNSFESGGVQ